jgi:very-short-patch-repair endonuclease
LRKNMTIAENIFWNNVKAKKFEWLKFQRQNPMYMFTENNWLDRFIIPDFICFEEKLIIEIDGSIHNIPEVLKLDRYKEKMLVDKWYKVIRFKNDEVIENIEKVLEIIKTEK